MRLSLELEDLHSKPHCPGGSVHCSSQEVCHHYQICRADADEAPHDGDHIQQLQASSQQEAEGQIAQVLRDRAAPDGAGPAEADSDSPVGGDAAEQEPPLSPQVCLLLLVNLHIRTNACTYADALTDAHTLTPALLVVGWHLD